MVATNITIDNINPAIKYLPIGAWSEGSTDPKVDDRGKEYFNSTFTLTTEDKASASLTFNGTAIWIYGAKRSNHGTYSISLDGSNNDFSGKDEANIIRATLYSATSLKQGLHTVNIVNTQRGSYLDVDYITYTTEIGESNETLNTTLAEDTDSAFTFNPVSFWSTSTSQLQGFSSNTAHATFENDAFVTYSFTGDAVAIYGAIGPTAGPYTGSVDGGEERSFNASKTAYTAQVMLFEANNLGPGQHSVKLTNKPSSFGQSLSIDYATVTNSKSNSTSGSSASDSSGSSGISGGAIAGIVVGVLGALAIIAVLVFFFLRKRKRSTNSDSEKPDVFAATSNTHSSPYSGSSPSNNNQPNSTQFVEPFTSNTGSRMTYENNGTILSSSNYQPVRHTAAPPQSEFGGSSSAYSGPPGGSSITSPTTTTRSAPYGYPSEKGSRVLNSTSPQANVPPSGSGGFHPGDGGHGRGLVEEEGREVDAGPLPPSYNQALYRE